MPPLRTLIIGSRGQLGIALQAEFTNADLVSRDELDVSDAAAVAAWPWQDYELVLNAAAYTEVDAAETADGRRVAWAVNAEAPARLARLARDHRITLVHFSSDYVFDGSSDIHTEDERLSPLGVYAQTKAAGDLAVGIYPRHYLLRTSWVVGEGNNFVRTMQRLADNGVSPSVVADQIGRLTFTTELARATRHLIETQAPYGTYNVSNDGEPTSWADIAASVFRFMGRDPQSVTPITSADYAEGKDLAPRPANSTLDLSRLRSTGFEPENALVALERYCAQSPSRP